MNIDFVVITIRVVKLSIFYDENFVENELQYFREISNNEQKNFFDSK